MKPVLIIENSTHGLKLNESAKIEDKYLLAGEFTAFDVRNRNERIYTAKDFVPHLENMMSKKEWGVIYGEYDHPDSFDVSMKYVSHTIESAVYSPETNAVNGEIRLLNTQFGKDAKALVDDGLPLFVSSRAAGITESNGEVKLKQLFTYDIVADPGFSSAKMSIKTINESFNIKRDNIAVLESNKHQLARLSEKYERSNALVLDLTNATDTNKLFEMNKNDMITKKQFSDYSKHLITEINANNKKIMKKIAETKGAAKGTQDVQKLVEENEALRTTLDKVIGYLDYMAEKVSIGYTNTKKLEAKTDKLVKYTNYLSEGINKTVEYTMYVAENLDQCISYSEYLSEGINKNVAYSNYLAENLDKAIDYSCYIAETLDKNIKYAEYIAENLDNSIKYGEYIAEKLNSGVKYMEYVAEAVDNNIGFTQYVAENLSSSIDYADYLSECIDKTLEFSNSIVEKLNNSKTNTLNEKLKTADEYLGISVKENKTCKTKPAKKIVTSEEEETVESTSGQVVENTEISENINGIINDKNSTENLSSKIDNLIKEAKLRKASEVQKPNFYEFLKPEDIKTFESFTREEREEITVALEESLGYYSRHDVLTVWKNVLEKRNEIPYEQKLLNSMPEDIKPLWEKCDLKTKKSIFAKSKLYDVSNEAAITHFWETRCFKQIEKENNKTLLESVNPFENFGKLSDEDIKAIEERFNNL